MPNPPHAFWLYQAAFALQLPAVLLFVGYAFAPRRALALAATACLAASLAAHAGFTLALGVNAGRLPLASGFEAISFWGLVLTALVVQVEWRHRLGLLSAATLLMGFRFAKSADLPAPGLADAWLAAHVALAMLSYALFTAGAGAAGAYLVQDRQLKAKRMGPLVYELPPLQDLERLLARLSAAGLAALVLGLATGWVWRLGMDLPPAAADPKVAFNVAMAGAYALALALRLRGPLRGRRFAWISLALFALIFFGIYLVNLYFGGHAFLRPQGA